MTYPVQLDLFDGVEEQPVTGGLRDQPAKCPCCHTIEHTRDGVLVNHGVDIDAHQIGGWPIGQHPVYGKKCVAQNLAQNHLMYAILNDQDTAAPIARCHQLRISPDAIIVKAQAQRDLLCDTCRRATNTIHNHCATCAHEVIE